MFNKISKNTLGILSLSLLFGTGCVTEEELGGCKFPIDLDGAYTLVWSDEFDGTELDASKWSYDLGDGCDREICGWGNNELQYYTDDAVNCFVQDGRLIIKAVKPSSPHLGQYAYTSARIVTKGKGDWRYGRIDVRAKLPKGRGLWPAIWMLPTNNVYGIWPKSGEIDIMEAVGHEPDRVFGTIHFGNNGWRYLTEDYFLDEGSFQEEFHVFSVLWNEDCIEFLMDGTPYSGPYSRSSLLPSTWPFDQDFHIILNVAVGGNLPGNPDATTQFPQQMEVDYVRVYQEK